MNAPDLFSGSATFRTSDLSAKDSQAALWPSRFARLVRVVERDHGRIIEIRREPADAGSHSFELAWRLDRDGLRARRCTGVDADLPVGQVGRFAG